MTVLPQPGSERVRSSQGRDCDLQPCGDERRRRPEQMDVVVASREVRQQPHKPPRPERFFSQPVGEPSDSPSGIDLEQTVRGLLRGFGLKVGDVSRVRCQRASASSRPGTSCWRRAWTRLVQTVTLGPPRSMQRSGGCLQVRNSPRSRPQ